MKLRTLTIDEQRGLRLAAVKAVSALAASPLPEHERKRAAEGLHRKTEAVRAVMAEAKTRGGPDSPCGPEQAKAALETARILVQAVYDFLRLFGVIGKNGALI